jgi:tryptophan synthase beta subunit
MASELKPHSISAGLGVPVLVEHGYHLMEVRTRCEYYAVTKQAGALDAFNDFLVLKALFQP